jgi:hypothetical protein
MPLDPTFTRTGKLPKPGQEPAEKEKFPRLSVTLEHPRQPDTCQSCGRKPDGLGMNEESARLWLERWIEHNDNDGPGNRVAGRADLALIIVVLCPSCSRRIIEPHPRLYSRMDRNKPWPGSMMHLCLDCKFRDGLTCTHPDSKLNGGDGLMMNVAQPVRGFVDARKPGYSGRFEHWSSPAKSCAGKATV